MIQILCGKQINIKNMITLKIIITGWVLLGLLGTVLSKMFFKEPPLDWDNMTPEVKIQMELGKEALRRLPALEVIIDLILGMLYQGQHNFLLFIGWMFRLLFHRIKWIAWHIRKPIHEYLVSRRVQKIAKRIKENNPTFTQKEIEDEIMVISLRWQSIHRPLTKT